MTTYLIETVTLHRVEADTETEAFQMVGNGESEVVNHDSYNVEVSSR